MKYVSFAVLAVALLLVVVAVWLAYFPPQPSCPPYYTYTFCNQSVVRPGDIVPLWWPPSALALWIAQVLMHWRGRYKTSILICAVIAVGIFLMRWYTSGFVRLW